METINWDILLHELESGKCVFCIGADIFSEATDRRLETQLADTLRQQSAALGIRVYDDGWFHYLKDRDELSTWFAIKNFYETQLPSATSAIFKDIAALPLHLILNFSPDYALRDTFKTSGKPFEFDCLYKNPETDKSRTTAEGTKEKPLIFNMLGEIEDKDSLVMTYDDLFGYMAAIFELKRMPQSVKLKIQNATHFIFLGMPLDKWYYHLFMRVLNLHHGRGKTKRFAAANTVDAGNATFCEEQYTLTYVKDNIATFANLLKNKWLEAEAKKTGRDNRPLSMYDRWREKVTTGEDIAVKSAFKELREHAADNDLRNQQLLLEMQWMGFQGTAFETELSKMAMKTQIIKGLMGLIDAFEEATTK